MADDSTDAMRAYIVLAEELFPSLSNMPVMETMEEVEEHSETEVHSPIIHDLNDLVFKLRGFLETESGDYALGVEMGMQRAADMIENLIRRHTEGNQLG